MSYRIAGFRRGQRVWCLFLNKWVPGVIKRFHIHGRTGVDIRVDLGVGETWCQRHEVRSAFHHARASLTT